MRYVMRPQEKEGTFSCKREVDNVSYKHTDDDVFQVAQILKRALARCEQGQKCYGVFDPETDPRDLFEEMEQELLDTINYAAFQILRVRAMRDKATLTS